MPRKKIISPENAAIAHVLMQRNKDKNFVRRAYDPNQPVIRNSDGSYSTHLMAYGDNRVFPTIVQNQQGQLQKLSMDNAWDYADSTGQYIEAPSEKIAQMLAEYGYKHASEMKYANGGISVTGYKENSPHKDRDYNVIPSNSITMKGVKKPIMGVDNKGNQQLMLPGYNYQFPGQYVTEYPVMQYGGPITPNERSAWERMQTAAYQQGYYGNDHSKVPGQQFMQQYGVDPNRLQAYQHDFQNFQQTDPNRISYGNELSKVDDIYGSRTSRQRYKNHQYITERGGKQISNFTTGTEPISMQEWDNRLAMNTQKPVMNQQMNYNQPTTTYNRPKPTLESQGLLNKEQAIAGKKVRGNNPDNFYLKDGGIHINPANKGKFTASAQHAGMGVQEFARHVLANKEDYSSTQVKRANFARSASKFKHQMGGVIQGPEYDPNNPWQVINPNDPNMMNQVYSPVQNYTANNTIPINNFDGAVAQQSQQQPYNWQQWGQVAASAVQLQDTVNNAAEGFVDYFSNRKANRELQKRNQWLGSSENLYKQQQYATADNKGDYVQNGFAYGQYRPQLNTFKGMYKGGGTWAAPNFYEQGGQLPKGEFGFSQPFVAPLLPTYNASANYAPQQMSVPVVDEAVVAQKVNTPKEVKQKAKDAKQYLESKGLRPHEASGIVGNLIQESSMNPGITNSIGAYGLAQWLGPRKKALFNWAASTGRNPYDMYTQLDYIMEEPGESAKMLKALNKTSTPTEAAATFSRIYERPGKGEANIPRRAGHAENLMYKEGGEYMLDEITIAAIEKAGGKIRFID